MVSLDVSESDSCNYTIPHLRFQPISSSGRCNGSFAIHNGQVSLWLQDLRNQQREQGCADIFLFKSVHAPPNSRIRYLVRVATCAIAACIALLPAHRLCCHMLFCNPRAARASRRRHKGGSGVAHKRVNSAPDWLAAHYAGEGAG